MRHHTTMPPSLGEHWNFGGWDNRKTSVPPWSYRNFWYHDETGDFGEIGHDSLVILWRYGFDDGGREIVCGDIYRPGNGLKAIFLWRDLCKEVDGTHGLKYDGVFIFHGTRRVSEASIYGKPFPYPLPDGRWRV